jgi:hypothetical protein
MLDWRVNGSWPNHSFEADAAKGAAPLNSNITVKAPHAEDKRDPLVDRAVFEVLSLCLSGPEWAPRFEPRRTSASNRIFVSAWIQRGAFLLTPIAG